MTALLLVASLPKHYGQHSLMPFPLSRNLLLTFPGTQQLQGIPPTIFTYMWNIIQSYHRQEPSKENSLTRSYTHLVTIQYLIYAITVMLPFHTTHLQSPTIAHLIWATYSPVEKWTLVSLFRRYSVTNTGTPLTLTLTLSSNLLRLSVCLYVAPPLH